MGTVELAGKGAAGLNSSPQCTHLFEAKPGCRALAPKPSQKRVPVHAALSSLGFQSLVCQGLNCKQSLEGRQREQVWVRASGNFPTSNYLQQPKTQGSNSAPPGATWQMLVARDSGQSLLKPRGPVNLGGWVVSILSVTLLDTDGLAISLGFPQPLTGQLLDNLRVGRTLEVMYLPFVSPLLISRCRTGRLSR